MHAVWRFTGLAGYAPEPEDFDPDRGWPTADEVEAVFGSWDKMLDESGIDDAIFGVVVEKALSAHEKLAAREKELELRAGKLEDEGKRIPELKRREEVARAKRDEADGARAAAEAARDAVGRERDAAAARVAELEAEVAALRTAAAAVADAPPAENELLEEMERTLAAAAATQQARDELHEHMERLRAEREQDRRTIAELTQLLARVDTGAEDAGALEAAEPEAPPATVLEAVERAAAESQHLRFAPKAFETAAESPFRRPGLVLRTLRGLDALAARYAAGDMGKSLGPGRRRARHHAVEGRHRRDHAQALRGRLLVLPRRPGQPEALGRPAHRAGLGVRRAVHRAHLPARRRRQRPRGAARDRRRRRRAPPAGHDDLASRGLAPDRHGDAAGYRPAHMTPRSHRRRAAPAAAGRHPRLRVLGGLGRRASS